MRQIKTWMNKAGGCVFYLVKDHGYKVVHVLGGVLIGFAGLAGIVLALFVLAREFWQESEDWSKAKTNIAWKDLTEWTIGVAIGIGLRCVVDTCTVIGIL